MQYKIGDVARILGISTDLLRYYEKKGVVAPTKDKQNDYRYYDVWDINFLIDCLWYKSFGFGIPQIAYMVSDCYYGDLVSVLEEKETELMDSILRGKAGFSSKTACETAFGDLADAFVAERVDRFAEVDDDDIMVAVKHWQHSDDEILSTLCRNLVNRRLPAIRFSNTPFKDVECDYFHGTGELHNRSYDFNDQEIKVLYKDGRCVDISEASDQLDRRFLEKQVTKYFCYFPKER